MSYIIVWRNSHKSPHILTDDHGFKEVFGTYGQAEEFAKYMMDQWPDDSYFRDYAIYQEAEEK